MRSRAERRSRARALKRARKGKAPYPMGVEVSGPNRHNVTSVTYGGQPIPFSLTPLTDEESAAQWEKFFRRKTPREQEMILADLENRPRPVYGPSIIERIPGVMALGERLRKLRKRHHGLDS